jgi:hypothetical protein
LVTIDRARLTGLIPDALLHWTAAFSFAISSSTAIPRRIKVDGSGTGVITTGAA